MNHLCLLTDLTSSDLAAWAQAVVGILAIIAGAVAVYWQVRRGRLELAEREARAHDGLARLIIHLKDAALDARAEKRKIKRWPQGHPAEPSLRFQELAESIQRFPLESVVAEVPLEALLNARRASKEMWPLVSPEPELDVNPNFERTFAEYIGLLEQQIQLLRVEAQRLINGQRARHAAAAPEEEER